MRSCAQLCPYLRLFFGWVRAEMLKIAIDASLDLAGQKGNGWCRHLKQPNAGPSSLAKSLRRVCLVDCGVIRENGASRRTGIDVGGKDPRLPGTNQSGGSTLCQCSPASCRWTCSSQCTGVLAATHPIAGNAAHALESLRAWLPSPIGHHNLMVTRLPNFNERVARLQVSAAPKTLQMIRARSGLERIYDTRGGDSQAWGRGRLRGGEGLFCFVGPVLP